MDYRELIEKFAESCGLDGSQVFDENGVASIRADDTTLSFVELPPTRQIVTLAPVADKPADDGGRLYEALLEAHYLGRLTEGAAFSLSPEGQIVLYRRDALAELDVAAFAEVVEGFLNLVDEWRGVIGAYRPDAPRTVEEPPPERDGSFHFIQV